MEELTDFSGHFSLTLSFLFQVVGAVCLCGRLTLTASDKANLVFNCL
jgi:hypothetical protein